MTPPRWAIEVPKWAAGIAIFFALAWVMAWNEYDSPWGRVTQEAKRQHLIAKLCGPAQANREQER